MKRKCLSFMFFTLFAVSSCNLFDKQDKIATEKEKIEKDTESSNRLTPEKLRAQQEKRERLIKDGKQAPATVDAIEDTKEFLNKKLKLRLYLKVKPEKGDGFDAIVDVVVSRFAVPHVGQNVSVYYNPEDKTDIIIE